MSGSEDCGSHVRQGADQAAVRSGCIRLSGKGRDVVSDPVPGTDVEALLRYELLGLRGVAWRGPSEVSLVLRKR